MALHQHAEMGSDRSFGLIVGLIVAAIGLAPLLRDGGPNLWLLAVATPLVLLGLVAPTALRPLNVLWFRLGLFLGGIVAPIVMALLFFLVIAPIGLLRRLVVRDPLNKRFVPNQDSYWQKRTAKPESMKFQF